MLLSSFPLSPPDRATDAPKELAARYSKQPFDVVLDTVGDPTIYQGSDAYLKGTYYNVGANLLTPGEGGLFALLKFTLAAYLLPTFLGGNRAKFYSAGLDNAKMPKFAALVKGESKREARKSLVARESSC